MKHRCMFFTAVSLLLLLALTACVGGGDIDDTEPVTSSAAESAQPTEPATEAPPAPTDETTEPPTEQEVEINMSYGDNILISVPVWRPEWATPAHMKLLRDAGVDFVVTVSGIKTATFDTSDKLIEAARSVWVDGKPGIRVMVHNTNMGERWLGRDEAYIKKQLEKYIGNDAVAGYHIWDEPYNPTALTPVERTVKGLDPTKIADINFLPGMVYGTYTEYEGRLDDYAKIMGDRASYLSFDNYPFGGNGVDETALFGNFEAVRNAGIANDVPTAFYLQAVGSSTYGYTKPDAGILYYHTGAALAYGFKWIKYWSWYVPDYGDPAATYNDYTDAIMGKDGKPTELYDIAKALHSEVHAIGSTLINLEATEVYHTGSRSSNPTYTRLPKDSFVSTKPAVYSIVSLMTDRLTGEHYLMVVNKNYDREATLTYTLKGVDTVWEINRETGDAIEQKLTDNTLSVTLPAGGFAIYRLPEGAYTAPEKALSDNLMANGKITASWSETGNGWFIRSAFDGNLTSTVDSAGYRYVGKESTWIASDLGAAQTFNRLTVYPAGINENCGASYPTRITLQVSDDGETYTDVLTVTPACPETVVPSFSFDPVTARYVRVVMESGATDELTVAEIKIYDDGGHYEEETTAFRKPVAVKGENIALHKAVSTSGSSYEAEGWGNRMLTDGSIMQTEADGTNGWMSNGVKNRTDPAWATVDLGYAYEGINRVVIYPRKSGERFPTGYKVEVSVDGQTWTEVAVVTADPYTKDGRVHDFEAITARYVRVTSTEMHKDSYVDFAGGYMMQLSELEVYSVE